MRKFVEERIKEGVVNEEYEFILKEINNDFNMVCKNEMSHVIAMSNLVLFIKNIMKEIEGVNSYLDATKEEYDKYYLEIKSLCEDRINNVKEVKVGYQEEVKGTEEQVKEEIQTEEDKILSLDDPKLIFSQLPEEIKNNIKEMHKLISMLLPYLEDYDSFIELIINILKIVEKEGDSIDFDNIFNIKGSNFIDTEELSKIINCLTNFNSEVGYKEETENVNVDVKKRSTIINIEELNRSIQEDSEKISKQYEDMKNKEEINNPVNDLEEMKKIVESQYNSSNNLEKNVEEEISIIEEETQNTNKKDRRKTGVNGGRGRSKKNKGGKKKC